MKLRSLAFSIKVACAVWAVGSLVALVTPSASAQATPLGAPFEDAEWGFDFRLPEGFAAAPSQVTEQAQQQWVQSLKAHSQAEFKARVFVFTDSAQATLVLKLLQPAWQYDSGQALKSQVHATATSARVTIKEHSPPEDFQARGGLAGFLVSFDFAPPPSPTLSRRKYVAWTRTDDRSIEISLDSPEERGDALKPTLLASLASIGLKRSERAGANATALQEQQAAPARGSPPVTDRSVLFNLAVVVGLGALLFFVLKRRPPATA